MARKLVSDTSWIKSPEQIEGIRRAGVLNTAVLDRVAPFIKPGISTKQIDEIVYDFTTKNGGIPAPLNYEGFPCSCCTSVNEVVCHGIPNEFEVLRAGDIINVDVTTILDGFYADASRMFVVGGKTSKRRQALVDCAYECLKIGQAAARPSGWVGDIGYAIAQYARSHGYGVVKDLTGHGVGVQFHEEPDIPHYGQKGTGYQLLPGMVFTIEPMINMKDWRVFVDEDDGWTVITWDELPSAQWEHTFLMTENGLEILSY